jgi:iron-sulfur cluster insertion protein
MMTISDSAAARIASLTETGEFAGQKLRIAINPGGCSGFEYAFSFTATANADDKVFEHNGAIVLIDETSLGLMDGAVLDFETSLMGAHFSIKNPNASSGCGCGNSFGIA